MTRHFEDLFYQQQRLVFISKSCCIYIPCPPPKKKAVCSFNSLFVIIGWNHVKTKIIIQRVTRVVTCVARVVGDSTKIFLGPLFGRSLAAASFCYGRDLGLSNVNWQKALFVHSSRKRLSLCCFESALSWRIVLKSVKRGIRWSPSGVKVFTLIPSSSRITFY